MPLLASRLLWRRAPLRRCQGGANLAGDDEFESQQALARRMLAWYALYPAILRRLESGDAPAVAHLFCGAGGDAEGRRRAGGAGIGVDCERQADFIARFGEDAFARGDASSWAVAAAAKKKARAMGGMAGPPCQFYSTIRVRGEARSPPMIDGTRDMLRSLFDYWSIENVPGARRHMRDPVELRGSDFGLRVDRPRLFEANFEIRVDRCVRRAGDALRARCCQGRRRRWRSQDSFGRPAAEECCCGNTFALQGTSPWRCTLAECADAMGVDVGHMSYERLAQAVPPAYGQLVFSQMCMAKASREFGVPAISFDEYMADPRKASRAMSQWLRGAGEASPSLAVELKPVIAAGRAREEGRDEGSGESGEAEAAAPVASGARGSEPSGSADDELFRELYYSHAGGFNQRCLMGASDEVGAHLLDELRPNRVLLKAPTITELLGRNTYVEASGGRLRKLLPLLAELVDGKHVGTRVTLKVECRHESWARRAGLRLVSREIAEEARAKGYVFVHCGRRGGGTRESYLDHDEVEKFMDPRDLGVGEEPKSRKEMRAWLPYPWDAATWQDESLPPEVRRLMTEGAKVETLTERGAYEVAQYPYPSGEALAECILEADRSLAIGQMEVVPDGEVHEALENGIIHPWLIVQQGAKWRACHDYSCGTNRSATTAPFGLPTTWDVRRLLKSSSRMVKYDLRDGFYAVPVAEGSRNRLMMRHPGTGRLLRCARLPFGYLDSPRLFCSVSEAMAAEVRRRAAGLGISVLCFVDDYLLIGDDEEAARLGGEIFESVMRDFGLHWAPQKQRGPCACIEFLGLLVCNVEGHRCIGLSRKRQAKMREMIGAWMAKRPREGRSIESGPKELASLLGHLVFASQVIPGGRTYMQGMLSQFKGLVIDWARGAVTFASARGGESWGLIRLNEAFWRDLEWFDDHFERRNCTQLEGVAMGEAAITGTDASDWGTGQLVWLDGAREEVVLRFAGAEKRRSINWRELLGILRIFEHFGPRLAGKRVLVETDNMSAKGAAAKLASKAGDMQELVRRLLEAAEENNISLHFTHTPGVKLHRPDQTSRGDPVEEPRARLERDEFELLEQRFGPFTEMLGAERELASRPEEVTPRIWMHPTYNTVGSALRLLGERMARGDDASGVIVVPDDPSAAWWRLTRHFQRVGGFKAGASGLETMRYGEWRPCSFPRDTLILAFPRAAGGMARPVWLREHEPTWGSGYVKNVEESARALPLPAGAFVYSGGPSPGEHGNLYVVWRGFSPGRSGGVYLSATSDVQCVHAAELQRAYTLQGRAKKKVMDLHQGKPVYALNMSKKEGSFAPGVGCQPFAPSAELLWSVDHLVREVGPEAEPARGPRSTGLRAKEEAQRRFVFDYKQAERELAGGQARRAAAVAASAEALSAPPPSTSSSAAPQAGRVAQLVNELEKMSVTPDHAPESPDRMERRIRAEKRAAAQRLAEEAAEASIGELTADEELERAAASAAEAAMERSRPPAQRAGGGTGQEVESRLPPLARGGRQPNKYAGTKCAGCGQHIGVGVMMMPGGRAMCHAVPECVALAERELAEAVASSQAKVTQALSSEASSEKREAQLKHRFSDARCQQMRDCVEGRCKSSEDRIFCSMGCGRGVHVTTCLQMSKHRAVQGKFKCGECRAAEMAPHSCTPLPSLVRDGDKNALLELATGAEGTAANYSEFARLERLWLAQKAADSGADLSSFVLPRHGEESFISFLRWLVTDVERARSFHTIYRAAAGVMAGLSLENLTKAPRVKQVVKELGKSHGVAAVPDTHATRRILSIMFERTLDEVSESLRARSKVMATLEVMGGVRVGESCGGGDGHGALANDLCLMRPVGSEPGCEEETVELWVADSKTLYPRYVNFVGKSRGIGIEAAAHVRALWKEAGLKITTTIEDGLIVERPDYWVTRVSLVDMSDAQVEKLKRMLSNCVSGDVSLQAKASLVKLQQRRQAKTRGEEHKYVNIAGGEKDGKQLRDAEALLRAHGLAQFADAVPGPLLRATHGRRLSHMPLAVESSYTQVIGALKRAWSISQSMDEPDVDLDLEGLEKPKWAHHSFRRTADRIARATMAETGALKEDLDDMFGWKQAERAQDMQSHYAGRLERSKRARITMMI